jgi:hypothetical protein
MAGFVILAMQTPKGIKAVCTHSGISQVQQCILSYYNTPRMVSELLSHGDIYELCESIGERHSAGSIYRGEWCLFFERDKIRLESGSFPTIPKTFKDEKSLLKFSTKDSFLYVTSKGRYIHHVICLYKDEKWYSTCKVDARNYEEKYHKKLVEIEIGDFIDLKNIGDPTDDDLLMDYFEYDYPDPVGDPPDLAPILTQGAVWMQIQAHPEPIPRDV